MFNYFLENTLFSYKEYIYALFLLNVIIYLILLLNIFIIFFIFDIKYIKTLNELKFLGNIPSFSIFVVLTLMSFAGIPPLLGFTGKFLIFISLLNQSNLLFVFFFVLINIFLMYFYIQNFRFLVSKKINSNIFLKKNFNFYKNNLPYLMVLFSCFNIIGIFFLEDIFIYLNYISSTYFI